MICPAIGRECAKEDCLCFVYKMDFYDTDKYVNVESCCNPIYKYHPGWDEEDQCYVMDWDIE